MDSDQGKIFVGGISWETTEEKLRDHFSAFGDVVEAVIMKDRATGRGRGFGFIVFADQMVSDLVLQKKHNIDGRMVEAKKAVPREEQSSSDRNSNSGGGSSPMLSNPTRTKRIFVGGLSSTVTETDFRSYFEQFGSITDVVVMYDHGTQRPRGFGFITYESEDSVERVLLRTFHDLKDKRVEVKRAVPKDLTLGPNRGSGVGGLSVALARSNSHGGLYAQAFNSSTISPYNMRSEARYNPSLVRHSYSAHGLVGYGSHSPSMSVSGGLYSEGAYRISPNASNAYGSIGCNDILNDAYGSYPGRSVWSTEGGKYGSFSSSTGFRGSTTTTTSDTMNNYGGLGTLASSFTQSSMTHNVAYNDRRYGYKDIDALSVNSTNFGYAGQNSEYNMLFGGNRSGVGNSLFGDIHSGNNCSYNASTCHSSADTFDSSTTAFGGIYTMNDRFTRNNGDGTPAMDDGYGVQGRSSYRGTDLCTYLLPEERKTILL